MGLGGPFDVNVMPGLPTLFWMSRSVPFTDVSVLDENRILPGTRLTTPSTERSFSWNRWQQRKFLYPPRCDCKPSLPFLSIFGGPDENGVGWNRSSRQLLKRGEGHVGFLEQLEVRSFRPTSQPGPTSAWGKLAR